MEYDHKFKIALLLIVGSIVSYSFGIAFAVSYQKAKHFADGNCTVSLSNIHEQTVECSCGRESCSYTKTYCILIFVRINEDDDNTRLLKLYKSEKYIRDTCFVPLCDKPLGGYHKYVEENYPIGKMFSCSYSRTGDEAIIEKRITNKLYINFFLWPSVCWVIFIAHCLNTSELCKRHVNTISFLPLKMILMHFRSNDSTEHETT